MSSYREDQTGPLTSDGLGTALRIEGMLRGFVNEELAQGVSPEEILGFIVSAASNVICTEVVRRRFEPVICGCDSETCNLK